MTPIRLIAGRKRLFCLASALSFVCLALLGTARATAPTATPELTSYSDWILQGQRFDASRALGIGGGGVIMQGDPPEISPVTPVLPRP